jgi:GAF domain-containing protein
MPDDRLIRVLARLAAPGGSSGAAKLCEVCAEITEVSGAGIMLLSDNQPAGSLCTTDEVSALIEELQYTLGEGPCVEAYRHHAPVAEPDLARPAALRWGAFTPSAVAAGVRAVFGFPLSVGDVHIGALNLYRDRPGPLTGDQHADAVVAAGVAARTILSLQAAPGELSPDIEASGNFRFVVHQAAGMIAVQLGVPVADALLQLRARAFSSDRPIVAVAHDIVKRRVRFDELDD